MERARKNFPMAIVSLFAILALIFGASEAMAKNAATACMVDPPHQLGQCISQTSCEQRCVIEGGPDATGVCFDGCCACFL